MDSHLYRFQRIFYSDDLLEALNQSLLVGLFVDGDLLHALMVQLELHEIEIHYRH